eukprot:12138845-Ditylum_brightwellii.AAC.2
MRRGQDPRVLNVRARADMTSYFVEFGTVILNKTVESNGVLNPAWIDEIIKEKMKGNINKLHNFIDSCKICQLTNVSVP